ncbi:MAG: helicase associated domain-containing protein, partial [Smithella sp.]|nr:helicase associated domain-containing protein [Smithella sp.]
YKERTDDCNATNKYKTPEGYLLGSWQGHQRNRYKKGNLSPDKIERLEKIGFTWQIWDEQFEKGFQETLRHKERTGTPHAIASYKTPEDYTLGSWQNSQRISYKKGNLSPDRIKQLEEIGFKWELQEEQREEQFEKGFQETLLYKERTGNANAPDKYKTHEGYKLGIWQGVQKNNYKKGKISSDRIKRLENIGFKWGKETNDSG